MFCLYFGFSPLPVDLPTLLLYIQFLSRSFKSSQSIRNYVNGVNFLHSLVGLDTPLSQHFLTKLTIKGIARTSDVPPSQARPMTPEILLSILPLLDLSVPLHATLWSVFLVAFFSFSRLSNILPDSTFEPSKHFTRADFTLSPNCLSVAFRWSKTNQFHSHVVHVPLAAMPGSPLCPLRAFSHMLSLIPAPLDAPAFCLPFPPSFPPLTKPAFTSCLSHLLRHSGLHPQGYTGHSFRRGGATFAFKSGVPGELIKSHGQWKSDAYLRYLQFSPASKLAVTSSMALHLPKSDGAAQD